MTTESVAWDEIYEVPELPDETDDEAPDEGPPLGIDDLFPEAVEPGLDDRDYGAEPPGGFDGGRVQGGFSSPLPVDCRLTSGFGTRKGILHAGTDWAPPEPGQRGVSVLAVASGTVIAVGRGKARTSDRIPFHSGRFVWLDLGFHGGQRMRAYYGHLASVDVSEGQSVKAGQALGTMGGSGAKGENDFAVHLHFGVAQDHNRPVLAARRHGAAGWINADSWLRSKGIRVGTTAPVIQKQSKTVIAPAPSPDADGSETTKPATARKHVRSDDSIRKICIGASHGDGTTSLSRLIERYQHRQQKPLTLVHDAHWGAVTERHYQWVVSLQRALNQWKGIDLKVDGDFGKKTVARVREVQERNLAGAFRTAGGRAADGNPGPATARMLGIAPYPN
ncbi:peptidoglycan DD-metalloendopeptidase family protein [Microbacterium sp. A93]|uniref:peptidoglycan DD-metalloendopeptidase family protein n=1 Tax=Microbacterium sp. A93 TaxID=3450716 RepID=UPI003F4298EF